jgi:acyl dehydratase
MYFEDFPLNVKLTLGRYMFTEENIITFARAYDPQFFHIDKDGAAKSPYGGLIASGWHTAAVWMKLMLEHRRARIAAGEQETQANYVSPGIRDLRWLSPPRAALFATVQVRHRGAPIAAEIRVDADHSPARAIVRLAEPTVAAPGQAAVIYAGDRVLAGGWVAR